jgi:hypothetical protein
MVRPRPGTQPPGATAGYRIPAGMPAAATTPLPEISTAVRNASRGGAMVLVAGGAAILLVGLGVGYALWGRSQDRAAGEDARPRARTRDVAARASHRDRPVVQSSGTAARDLSAAAPTPVATVTEGPIAAEPASCQLSITSQPAGAIAFADGARLGATPFVGKAPCRETEIRLRKKYYKDVSQRATLAAGSQELSFKLVRRQTLLSVRSTPSGANVRINGRRVGSTPHRQRVPTGGDLSIKVEKAGFKDWSRSIKPEAKNVSLQAKLIDRHGSRR